MFFFCVPCFFCLALCVSNFVHVAVCNKKVFFFFMGRGEFVCLIFGYTAQLADLPLPGIEPRAWQ